MNPVDILVTEKSRLAALSIKQAFSNTSINPVIKLSTSSALDSLRKLSPEVMIIGQTDRLDPPAVCGAIRKQGYDLPILALCPSSPSSKWGIRMLENGADDYLPYPHNLLELVAKTKKLISRPPKNRETIIQIENIKFNFVKKLAFTPSSSLSLNQHPLRILELLITNLGVTISRSQLCSYLSTSEYEASKEAIDVHICRIRKEFKRCKVQGVKIKSVYGTGYKLITQKKKEGHSLYAPL